MEAEPEEVGEADPDMDMDWDEPPEAEAPAEPVAEAEPEAELYLDQRVREGTYKGGREIRTIRRSSTKCSTSPGWSWGQSTGAGRTSR